MRNVLSEEEEESEEEDGWERLARVRGGPAGPAEARGVREESGRPPRAASHGQDGERASALQSQKWRHTSTLAEGNLRFNRTEPETHGRQGG